MKQVFINFPNGYKKVAGPLTFMRNLQNEFAKLNFNYQEKPWLAKAMFFPIVDNINQINIVKAGGGKIIQRLDGVYYPSKHSDKYKEHNSGMKNIYQNYADHVVFQSKYSKKQVFEMFGEKPEEEYSIICNGANQEIFYPSKYKKLHKKVRFITTGNFRNKDMLNPVIEALDMLEAKGYNFELTVFGPIYLENKNEILAKKYVVNKESKKQGEIADALRSADVFIYSHLNPPCPNSIIEAISCGLPIVGFDSGSLKELCHFNSGLFADVSDKTFQVYEDFDSFKLAEKIELSIEKFDEYKANSLKHAKDYSMHECAKKYIAVFDKLEPSKANVILLLKLVIKLFVFKVKRKLKW